MPEAAEFAVLNVLVNNDPARRYQSEDAATGGRVPDSALGLIDPRTGAPQASWGAQDPCVIAPGEDAQCVDSRLYFGGSLPWEAGMLSFSAMAESESWVIYPSLADIRGVIEEVGGPENVVLSIYFRNPYAIDEASGLRAAGAILATFGVSDEALVDVLTGRGAPGGRLPFALPATQEAITGQHSDAPGYGEVVGGTLFPYGFGLGYGPRVER